jgi:bifunctional non-homologous end joining protein LigD
VAVGDVTVSLSNLEKPMYPQAGFTKGHVIDYYTRIAPVLLPHLDARPLTLKRYPDGVEKGFFYEKRCPSHRPAWVQTASVWSGRNEGNIDYCLCQDLPTLVWLANLADLELHTPMARAPEMDHPTMIAFDLDPGPPATIVECARVALELRRAFDFWDLEAFPKTSGSKGMQVYLPLNTTVTYADTREFSKGLAHLLARRDPDNVLIDMNKTRRAGKVFVDWSQNDRHKTTVNVYSLRAMEQPTVSTPLTWDEVSDVADGTPAVFTSAEVLARVEEHGDLFAPVQTLEQELPR